MTIKTKTYTGRQLRRMQAKAKPRPSKFHKNAMGASALFSQLAMCRPPGWRCCIPAQKTH